MQFEALKVFCDVARLRSFSQAAAANGLTQSAVSQIVLHLERRLGVQLVDRATRPFDLTPPGQVYFEGVKGLVDQYVELEARVRRSEAEMATNVQVAAIYSVGLRDMHHYVDELGRRQPNAAVRIDYVHPDVVYQRVLDGTADLGLVSYPRRQRELTAIPWREEEMVLACAPDHPLAKLRSVRLAQLAGARWVGFDAKLVIQKKLDTLLRQHRIAVDVQMRFDNIESIKRALEVSSGVSLLPRPTIERELQVGTLVGVPLAGVRLSRPLAIIHRSHRRLSAAALSFVEVLRHEDESGTTAKANGAGATVRRGAARAARRTR